MVKKVAKCDLYPLSLWVVFRTGYSGVGGGAGGAGGAEGGGGYHLSLIWAESLQ